MPERRVRIPKGHGVLVRDLLREGDRNGPFRYMVDVLAFAAAVGASRGRWNAVDDADGSIDPVRLEVFERRNYIWLIDLLAVSRDRDLRVLADDMESRRVEIFEGYLDGGLRYINGKLTGRSDYMDHIVEVVEQQLEGQRETPVDFDLRDILGAAQ